ncbi:hypothetical protein JX265_006739 [Neoarthrinium moseri]|uniref:Rhodopsin domain-containing protein n=1 Tax=Neoarthrinium moseri TaxID=1658444 RepID=A0A9Q0ALG1_9PEZI|nr:uncharacterized protein JN550_002788 [Neoarthrinium moseri]KAI1847067.1 hypothetical protein JX266_006942 [Neoarthrinium moseri]KAI1868760.1 hypothetical protein JX265_006739 [Neoarthrinium moseri]KAI1874209.1 hypothetical protein JN550_002788 [Neoarthrinium moseri]
MPVKDFVRAELIVNCLVVFAVLIVVSLRVFSRVTGAGLGLDDYFVILAAPLGIGMLVCQGFLLPIGSGYDLPDHPELIVNVPFIFLMSFIMEIIYVLCLAASKASMLFFYRRVFSTPKMLKAVDVVLGLLAVWTICFECACIFLCRPVNGFWTGQGVCGDFIPMIQSLIATNAVGDLVIMLMPMPIIWSLQMKTADKLGIMSCFTLGLACIVMAIFRVIYIGQVDLAGNITGTMPTTVLLFALEPNIAILCVSIPMLRPLYTRYKTRNASSRLYDYNKSGSGSNGNRTIGGISSIPGRSRLKQDKALDNTAWEMEDYYNAQTRSGQIHFTAAADNADEGDETSSEKALTKQAQKSANEGIGVKTTWTVTREA